MEERRLSGIPQRLSGPNQPFLLLILRVMRTMLVICAAALIFVGGAILYSITQVQGRALDSLSGKDLTGLLIIGGLLVVSLVIFFGAGRLLRQNEPD